VSWLIVGNELLPPPARRWRWARSAAEPALGVIVNGVTAALLVPGWRCASLAGVVLREPVIVLVAPGPW